MIFKILTLFLVLSLFGLITVANTGNGHFLLTALHTIPHGDKWMHLFMMGSITAFLNISLNFKKTEIFNRDFLTGTLIVAFVITTEEFSQIFIPYRNFEVLDLACNFLGTFVIGSIPYFLHLKYKGLFLVKTEDR